MKTNRTSFRVVASPYFTEVTCPVCRNYMKELQNGFFGHPVWWCKKCEQVYELQLHKREFDRELVDKQLAELKSPTEE